MKQPLRALLVVAVVAITSVLVAQSASADHTGSWKKKTATVKVWDLCANGKSVSAKKETCSAGWVTKTVTVKVWVPKPHSSKVKPMEDRNSTFTCDYYAPANPAKTYAYCKGIQTGELKYLLLWYISGGAK